MSASEYPIGTLAQMAAIPSEARSRFLAELPAILTEFAHFATVQGHVNEAFAGVCELSLGEPLWVDDDKGMTTITVDGPDDIGSIVVERKTSAAA